MRRASLILLTSILAVAGVTMSATAFRPTPAPAVTREVIAVYLGTFGTDAESGLATVVKDMKMALAKQASESGRAFFSRGVSLEPSVEGGIRHLALLGPFDEVSVGGNWTNSAVVRYLGPNMGRGNRRAGVPQVVLLEREVRQENSTLEVGPEREIGRFIGGGEIDAWVRRGAPLPR